MEKSIWEKRVRKNTGTKDLESCNRAKREVCAEKEESILIVERRKREGTGICGEPIKKRVYLTFQVTPNLTSIFCSKKGQKVKNSTRLLPHKPVDHKEQVPFTSYCGYIRQSRKEKGVYKARSEVRI